LQPRLKCFEMGHLRRVVRERRRRRRARFRHFTSADPGACAAL
jgi:hypothetical protein